MEWTIFKKDMIVLYKVKGRRLIKDYAVICLVYTPFLFLMKEPLELGWSMMFFIWSAPILMMVLSYLIAYFTDYRHLFHEIRKEDEMSKKYSFTHGRFMKKE